jgi:signal transduction histidine kinase
MLRARTSENRRRKTAAEPSRRRAADFESAARRYVAMAVHDLRNPLTVIAGYTALLDEESLGDLTAQQREAVDAIKRQARVLLSSSISDRARPHARAVGAVPCALRGRSAVRRPSHHVLRALRHEPALAGSEATFDFTSDRRRLSRLRRT